jgi:hydrogenase maturation protease
VCLKAPITDDAYLIMIMQKTILIGLGNPILTDDGVGVKVAYEIVRRFGEKIPKNLTITEASVGGLRLMELLEGYERAIIIDAIQTGNGHPIGSIFRLNLTDLREISPTQHSASAHDTSLVTALQAGIEMGMKLPLDITIFAVEVENIMDFSEQPTPAVAAAIPLVVDMVLDII